MHITKRTKKQGFGRQTVKENKTIENRLIQSQKLEAIGTLAGGIAHDFNNILTGILSYAQLIDMQTSDPPVKKAIRQIFNLGQKATDLTRQILLMGRKLPPEFKVVDLNTFLRESLMTFQRSMDTNIDLDFSTVTNFIYVKADPSQLTQALMNLTVNARDALLEKGGSIKINTSLFEADTDYCHKYAYARPGTYAVISVVDSGHGIPDEIKDRIFEPFFTTKSIGRGTGLGLSVTYSVVKNHGGWISFSSEQNKGTEFLIYLPIIETRAERPATDLKTLLG